MPESYDLHIVIRCSIQLAYATILMERIIENSRCGAKIISNCSLGVNQSIITNSSTPNATTRTLQAQQISRQRSGLIPSRPGTSAASIP